MKIELKHLAPYLPYQLTVKLKGGSIAIVKEMGENILFVNEVKGNSGYMWPLLFTEEAIPLLIPLTDLPKQAKATVVGIRNINQINSRCCYHIYHKDGETYFDDLPEQMAIEDVWDTYEQLFAGHYDVFGLIEQGLALNKLEHGQSK